MRDLNWTGSLPAHPRPAHGIFLTKIIDLQSSRLGLTMLDNQAWHSKQPVDSSKAKENECISSYGTFRLN
jgi:hypothetical protein